jgi:hypothetical protein
VPAANDYAREKERIARPNERHGTPKAEKSHGRDVAKLAKGDSAYHARLGHPGDDEESDCRFNV